MSRLYRSMITGFGRQNSLGSLGCHVFLDDIGPSPRPIEKLRLVRRDQLASAGSGELGPPGEKGGPVGKSQFCYDIEVDPAAFLSQCLAPHKVSPFVNEGRGRQAADQRDVCIFVVVDKS